MVKILVSPMNVEEAEKSVSGGADIIDVKNPLEGSLGANFPWVIKQIASLVKSAGKEISATIGDMDFKPGTASLAALGAAYSGADYIKVGLYGVRDETQAKKMLEPVVNAVRGYDKRKKVIAAAYADYSDINSVSPLELSSILSEISVDGIMVDTAVKDGRNLFDVMSEEDVKCFISHARKAGVLCALAGGIKKEHISIIKKLRPDIIGVRTLVCRDGRNTEVETDKVAELVKVIGQ